ncbi:NAD-dependent epimerase/dehydratase family protein [Cryptosporangium aurantiacum]|uniref:Nucleoside-diphosphate-sugar epimerase n=1 Tax=Cryptosporangium aurantiacum TaxID=134849 RepID=A0A1M7R3N9_9ACTN|nr:NAD-dependent epimerase/dehydratase family protein [Cryptosporangium aurantiacum]SHN39730.1 Nucleoside-diphosphate-sugar epimerase [Cryptosporangium aurantiacum]
MKVLIVGASGFVGSGVTRHLADTHEVLGLARSEESADRIASLGAEPVRGSVDDLDGLLGHAAAADATVFVPQLLQDLEHTTVSALLRSYAGTGKTFVFTSGTGVLGQRTFGEWSEDTFAEDDEFVTSKYLVQRRHTELVTRAASQNGVRAVVVRPPAIWGDGFHPFVGDILTSVDKTGSACYIGRGLNLYTHVSLDDLAELYRLVLDRGVAGALYHAAGGELNNRTLAECVARVHGVQTRSVSIEEAFEIWGKFTPLVTLGVSSRSRSPRSRRELGWSPQRTDVAQAILDGELNGKRRS